MEKETNKNTNQRLQK